MWLDATLFIFIVALRNEKGSYSPAFGCSNQAMIVALRNEKGSYSKNG